MCSTKKYPSGNFVGNLQEGFLKRKPFPSPNWYKCFPPQCLCKNMKKLSFYKKITKDYSDQQNLCMCARVYMYIHTYHPQTNIPAKDQTLCSLNPDLKGYIFNSLLASVLIRRGLFKAFLADVSSKKFTVFI